MAKFTQVGTIRLSQKNKLYINLNQGYDTKTKKKTTDNLVALHQALGAVIENPEENEYGLSLQIQKPEEKLAKFVESGKMTEEEMEAALEKVPDYIKYEITLIED